MTFYFAWVDKSETTFGPEHHREDESVFSLSIEHSEGDFPVMDVSIINPRVGLLTGSRKQWAWVAYDDGSTVTPLFFGRILGVPKDLQADLVGLTFVARPQDYEAQRAALADSLRVLPYFDPLFIAGDAASDPDSVLEGYSKLWHIDRVTHEVTVSDIIDDGNPTLQMGDATDVFRSSVRVSHGQSPARRVVLTGRVEWEQSAAGAIDITKPLLDAFKAATPETTSTISGMTRGTAGMINVIAGDDLLEKWPNPGDRIGAGWSIGDTALDIVGGYPLPPTVVDYSLLESIQQWSWSGKAVGAAVNRLLGRTPGVAVQVLDFEDNTVAARNPLNNGKWTRVGKFDILWVPIYRMAAHMNVEYSVARQRSETMTFALDTDVQPLLSDPADEETIYLDVGSANVDVPIDGVLPIPSVRGNRYFDTDRGRQSFEHMICRGRALLRARARAVDISFAMPFTRGLSISCKDTVTLFDDRLPLGSATGKVKQYKLSVDGDSGQSSCSITIGCAVGRGGAPSADAGTPTYAEDGYSNTGWQLYSDAIYVPDAGDVSYDDYAGYTIEDDGVDLMGLDRMSALQSLTVTGGLLTEQEEVASTGGLYNATGVEVVDRIRGAKTTLRIELLPLTGGPFDSEVAPVVGQLHIPKMIDLETE